MKCNRLYTGICHVNNAGMAEEEKERAASGPQLYPLFVGVLPFLNLLSIATLIAILRSWAWHAPFIRLTDRAWHSHAQRAQDSLVGC
jgi:hypothetical protein